ncbi:MAG: hypothetical protein Q8N47_28275 [Bryobacterales bacterium]|nr:hypothetical protein [Bryobacterales bacterium]
MLLSPFRGRGKAVAVGVMCAAVVLGWWALMVYSSYGGNWTALYCTGSRSTIPAALKAENTYIFPDSWGYDGQFYHFIAHDPWLTRGLLPSVDNPPLRWRRILVSALAWTLALGQDAWIDPAFYLIALVFVFLGGYWLTTYFEARGSPSWWGLLFLLSPTTLILLDRIVVDIAVTALCCGFLVYAGAGQRGALWGVLAASILARESGLVLLAGWCLWLIARREYRRAAFFAAAAAPAGIWWLWVARHTSYSVMPGWSSSLPPMRLIQALQRPFGEDRLVQAFDSLAIAGSLLAVALAARAAWRVRGYLRFVIPAFGVFGLALTGTAPVDVFQDVFSHARLLSPLTLLLAAEGLPRRDWLAGAPMAATALRLGLTHAAHLLRIVRALHAGG